MLATTVRAVRMSIMTAQEIRNAFLEYAKQNGHVVIPRANLVPQNDPTTYYILIGRTTSSRDPYS
jgi:alanyl-tRNA synthetase